MTGSAWAHAADRFAARIPTTEPPRSGAVTAAHGGLVLARGLDAETGTLCAIARGDGDPLEAEVVGFRGSELVLLPFDDPSGLVPGARVTPRAQGRLAAVGAGVAGRVLDALGHPADGLGPIPPGEARPLGGTSGAPLDRAPVRQPIATGVRAIDAFATIGRGQRIGLMAGSGVGKSVLLGMIARDAAADAVVVGLVGERGREIADFLETKLPPHLRSRATIVAATAGHAAPLRVRAALRAAAIAEHVRERGGHALLLMDSLTRVAHAQREIGLALGEPASARGYPPSALALIGRLVERAGACARSGGAVTAVYTVLADGDDAQDPVVDTARAILDGHIVLDRGLAERGHYPAIHPVRSLSRCMSDLVTPEHAAAARTLRRHYALYEENRDLFAMGAYRPGQDAELDAAVAAQPALSGFLAQRPDETAGFADTVARLQALV
ncbi:MAG: FliI/YscN family ATPase [Sphingomonadaceae bacterium]|nr:FliI/YscN family ATPase [Sphingomonadaceae bacterium]